MPPKTEITIIKFKRSRSSYVVSLILNQKKNPTSTYLIDALVHAINSSGGIRVVDSMEGILDSEEGIQVTSEEIKIAFPKTRDSPYSNEWIPISEDLAIELTTLKDYDTVAFKYVDDADFSIEEPVYEEEAV